MSSATIKISEKNILLVEGMDEYNFFNKIVETLSLNNVQVIWVGGKDKFAEKFSTLSKSPNFSEIAKIAFVRDAEANKAAAAFDSIKSAKCFDAIRDFLNKMYK